MTDTAISCRALHKRYGNVEAVRGLDLEVRRGECFGLLGPNGAGKTTTIEILEGLLEPTSGEVLVLGQKWNGGQQELRERLGITLQETHLPDKSSVIEILRLFRSFYARGRDIEEVLSKVALNEKRNARYEHLSGGQKQRLAVACALVGAPDLLFLDEPTTGLDPQSRRQLWDLVIDFRAGGGTVLITTHYIGGGRATLRPRRHRRPRPDDRAGHAARADRVVGRAGGDRARHRRQARSRRAREAARRESRAGAGRRLGADGHGSPPGGAVADGASGRAKGAALAALHPSRHARGRVRDVDRETAP
jgi:ABC-type Mn2+/Zn2+ transport system ATPase subunit